MSEPMIGGDVDPAFAAVADAFADNFRNEGEIGASICVFQAGRKVVDLWGGHADAARTRAWGPDTIVNVWSTTKGMMALCVARLVDQGLLANDRPVADYWPEFAANGKGAVTVAQLFSHQAGLCGPGRPLTEAELLDTDFVADLLAAMAPHWPVGTRSGYHALTIGPLGDGLFKRVVGKTVGQYFRDEIAGPLAVDFHIGLPIEEEGRVAEIVHDGNPESGGPESFNAYQRLAQQNVPVRSGIANLRSPICAPGAPRAPPRPPGPATPAVWPRSIPRWPPTDASAGSNWSARAPWRPRPRSRSRTRTSCCASR